MNDGETVKPDEAGNQGGSDRKSAQDDSDSALVDVKEAARLCRVSASMFYKLISMGKIPRPIKLGRLMRWHRRELMKWIDAGCPDSKSHE